MTVVVAVLLAAGVATELICAVGVVLARDAFDRLHLVGPAAVVGTAFIVAAVALDAHTGSHVARVVATGAVLWLSSPFLTRATARALRIRRTGRLLADGDEQVAEEGSA